MTFKLGDLVTWAGITGKIIKEGSGVDYSYIRVDFGVQNGFKQVHDFYPDGRQMFWHKESVLKPANVTSTFVEFLKDWKI